MNNGANFIFLHSFLSYGNYFTGFIAGLLIMKQKICNLFAQNAPEITHRFPARWGGEEEKQTYLDFIGRLSMEAGEILDRGDSLIDAESVPFSLNEQVVLLNAWKNIKDLTEGLDVGISERLMALSGALFDIHRFYSLRVTRSQEEMGRIEATLERYQTVVKPELLSQGDEGYAIVYGGLNTEKPDRLKGKNVNIGEYKDWQEEQDEVRSYYNGAAGINPMMLGVCGTTPEEYDMQLAISACEHDAERHKETAQEILTLINKMRAIGLAPVASENPDKVLKLEI